MQCTIKYKSITNKQRSQARESKTTSTQHHTKLKAKATQKHSKGKSTSNKQQSKIITTANININIQGTVNSEQNASTLKKKHKQHQKQLILK